MTLARIALHGRADVRRHAGSPCGGERIRRTHVQRRRGRQRIVHLYLAVVCHMPRHHPDRQGHGRRGIMVNRARGAGDAGLGAPDAVGPSACFPTQPVGRGVGNGVPGSLRARGVDGRHPEVPNLRARRLGDLRPLRRPLRRPLGLRPLCREFRRGRIHPDIGHARPARRVVGLPVGEQQGRVHQRHPDRAGVAQPVGPRRHGEDRAPGCVHGRRPQARVAFSQMPPDIVARIGRIPPRQVAFPDMDANVQGRERRRAG